MAQHVEFVMPSVQPDNTWFGSKHALLGRHHAHPAPAKTQSRIYIPDLEEAETRALTRMVKDTEIPVKVRKNALRLRLARP